MNRSKAVAMFVLFLGCFYSALTVKFYFLTDLQDESAKVYLILGSILLLGAVFLSFCIQAFSQHKSFLRAFAEGLSLGAVVFLIVSVSETGLSERAFRTKNRPEDFSGISGHCGVSVGRSILKFLHNQDPTPEGALAEFKLDHRCRLRHLDYVLKFQSSSCDPSEDKIDCLTRWMGPVAEHGYWNKSTRKYFFDAVMKAWPQSKKDEALVNYALKDLELESGRQSILRQVGMDENLSERYILMQEKDELDHLQLTKQVFETVAPLLNEAKVTPPPPYVFKFKDTQNELQTKLAKIPELEKEIDQMIAHPK